MQKPMEKKGNRDGAAFKVGLQKHIITAALTHLNKLIKVATVKGFYTNL